MITKYYFKICLFVLLVSVPLLNSCINKDDYSIPPLECVDSFPATNGSIAKLNTDSLSVLKPNESNIVSKDYIFEAYVSSSDESGNIYKTIFLQDHYESPTAAAEISIDATNQYADFPVGSKVRVNLKGLVVQEVNKQFKIGTYDPAFGVGRINPNQVGRYISRVCTSDADNLVLNMKPLEFNSIGAALKNSGNVNKLVKINNVQFKNEELVKNLSEVNTTANRIITDKKGNEITLRNSNFATFSNTPISPNYSGVGSVTMILSRFTNTNNNQITEQGYIRSLNDLNFSSDPNTRFVVGIPDEPSTNAVNLFNGSDFEDWKNAFEKSLNSYGLRSYAVQGVGKGRNGGNALHINGAPPTGSGGDIVFTAIKTTDIPENPNRITFYIKGKSASKSISISVFKKEKKADEKNYYSFNLGKLDAKIISPSENVSYSGSIDTNDEWVLVELDLENINDNISMVDNGNLFAFRVGKNSNFDILIDDIKIE